MTPTRFTLTVPENTWIGDVSRVYPEATIQLLDAVPGTETDLSFASIVTSNVDPVLETMAVHEAVDDVTVHHRTENRSVVQFESSRPLLLLAARRAGFALAPPVQVSDGTAVTTAFGVEDQIDELGRRWGDREIDYEVEQSGHPQRFAPQLTDTQRAVLLAAFEHGYYEQPRDCTLTELSSVLGCAKSTTSETLRSAEAKLVDRFVRTATPRSLRGELV